MDTYKQRTEKPSKQRSAFSSKGNATINGGTISVNQKFLDSKVGIWENIIDMRTCLQNMLREYAISLSVELFLIVIFLLQNSSFSILYI